MNSWSDKHNTDSPFFEKRDYEGPARNLAFTAEAEEKTPFGGECKEDYKGYKNDPPKPLNDLGTKYCGPGRSLGGK
jgi:hypothetical protein